MKGIRVQSDQHFVRLLLEGKREFRVVLQGGVHSSKEITYVRIGKKGNVLGVEMFHSIDGHFVYHRLKEVLEYLPIGSGCVFCVTDENKQTFKIRSMK